MTEPVRRTPAEVFARARATTLGQIIENAVIHDRQRDETYDEAIRDRVIPVLVEELLAAEERGREEVREYARTRQTIEERRLTEARRDAVIYLDPSQPVGLAAQQAVEAHARSSAVIAYRVVAGWTP